MFDNDNISNHFESVSNNNPMATSVKGHSFGHAYPEFTPTNPSIRSTSRLSQISKDEHNSHH
jgi:hypothetical protein